MSKISGIMSKSVLIVVLLSNIFFVQRLEAKAIIVGNLSELSANSLFREKIITPNNEPSSFLINKEMENIEKIAESEENKKSLNFNSEDNREPQVPNEVEPLESDDLENGQRKISPKQIIDAPKKKCPPGQRPDKNCRCRIILRK